MRSWANVFLTGKAWTWKTWTLQEFIKFARQEGKHVIITAPTGIAAINAGWSTLHSAFKMYGYYPEPKYPGRQKIDWGEVDIVVIDEISMVGPDYVDQMDFILKHERRNKDPFGWVQMIFVGDPKQLPPVYSPSTEQDIEDISKLTKKYWTLTFDNAKSYQWFEVAELSEVKRTKDDRLISVLNSIREWDFRSIMKLKQGEGTPHSVHLYPFNNMVDSHNKKKLEAIKSPSKTYKGHTYGTFDLKNCLTPLYLELKIWAMVMVTKNLECWLVNGDMWTVVEMKDSYVKILSDRFGEEFDLYYSEWKTVEYDWVEENTLWGFRQIPLKLWFALTIHKSQWLTLEDVCFHYVPWTSKELAYVWLSRATNYEGLHVKTHLR